MCWQGLGDVLLSAPNVLCPKNGLHVDVQRGPKVLRNVLREFDSILSNLRHPAALQHFFFLKIDGDVYAHIRIRI
jgi:hypothetical protein